MSTATPTPRLAARSRWTILVLSLGMIIALFSFPITSSDPADAATGIPGAMFTDDNGNPHEPDIEALAHAGITQGCNPSGDRFCPDSTLSRSQAAAFLDRALGLDSRGVDFFVDDAGSIFEENINSVAADGITRGCSADGTRFCPDDLVTRAQFASFLVRALDLESGGGDDRFTDDDGSVHEDDIDRLAAAGIANGCSSSRFCPDGAVTRAQAASFLVRALDLPSAPGWDQTPAAPTGEWPTPETTGPRMAYSELQSSGSITTTHDGQVIEGMDVTGRIVVQHDNVTIRDTRIRYDTNYGILLIEEGDDCVSGTVVEYVELDGSLGEDNTAPAYDDGCDWVLDHVHLHNAGSAIRTYGNSIVTNSYLVNDYGGDSGAHREPLLVRGSNHVIRNNVLICNVPSGGCSAALAIYGYPSPTTNILVEGNWLAATAAYCAYGGGTHEFGDEHANVDFINNAFSNSLTPESPECGRGGNISDHDEDERGNDLSGNYIYETGEPVR